ncbi:unnamed protein product, partial [Musa acuminata subsp. burmannicoides]
GNVGNVPLSLPLAVGWLLFPVARGVFLLPLMRTAPCVIRLAASGSQMTSLCCLCKS